MQLDALLGVNDAQLAAGDRLFSPLVHLAGARFPEQVFSPFFSYRHVRKEDEQADTLFFTRTNTGIPTITDCVLAELEKLGPRYRMALKVARDPRFDRLPCSREC